LALPETVALNCWLPLIATEAAGGVIATVGGDTAMLADAVKRFEPHVASIALEPPATPSARPVPLFTVAAAGLEELHDTEFVTFTKDPSL
jgi:hypothetical protein